jgi:ubiquinone/menaquinone biosynthesis C-methylase UbiE
MTVRRFGRVFDEVAEAYDAARPGYPPELVDAAVERGGLEPGSRVVEIGAGTGKLTELLTARGLDVDAVEPGENMIEAARRRAPAARYHAARFEDVELPAGAYEAVFSATAFHWVEPTVGWRKAATLLRPDGLLALLTHHAVADEFSEAQDALFLPILRRYAPDAFADERPRRTLEELLAGAEERRDNASEVWTWVMNHGGHDLAEPAAADLFADVEVATVVSHEQQTADEALAQFRTTSLWFRIPPEHRAAFEAEDRRAIEQLGGTLRYTSAAVLMTARRAG